LISIVYLGLEVGTVGTEVEIPVLGHASREKAAPLEVGPSQGQPGISPCTCDPAKSVRPDFSCTSAMPTRIGGFTGTPTAGADIGSSWQAGSGMIPGSFPVCDRGEHYNRHDPYNFTAPTRKFSGGRVLYGCFLPGMVFVSYGYTCRTCWSFTKLDIGPGTSSNPIPQ